ncbi:MAG: hypothetical protein WD734_02040, partial [Dehalococcoidia bacterium]
WTGKAFVTRFDEDTEGAGVNLFANRWAPLRYQMRTRIQPADRDGRPCLALVYPPGSVMFGLVDDLREIDDGLLLGVMGYLFPWSRRLCFVGYFALEGRP